MEIVQGSLLALGPSVALVLSKLMDLLAAGSFNVQNVLQVSTHILFWKSHTHFHIYKGVGCINSFLSS